jgi:small-conductance mechanosensitive channel/CRP-like cAMP-binding protein
VTVSISNLTIAGVVAVAATLALLAAIPSRYVRGRLKFSAWLLLAFFVLEGAASQGVGDVNLLFALARLVFVLAVVNLTVALLFNPWQSHRPSERVPAIVQDVAMIALFTVIGTVLMREQLLATSAVGAVVVGFALQDTLGNLFAGLAIQIEKPFRVGHWISVAGNEGQVQEITWRATKLRTKAGQFLIVPNSLMSKDPILNFSEPIVPSRVHVEIGAGYETPPNLTRRAILEALDNSPMALKDPPPEVVLHNFGVSALEFHVMFWVLDHGVDYLARDQVRTNLWYAFRRHGIEIPYPIQIEYSRDEQDRRTDRHIAAAAARLATIDLFAPLSEAERQTLSAAAEEQLFAAGEAVVRQDAPGDSMFVVLAGRVRVTLEPSNQEVAVIGDGGFFGEMSMLTGDPRTATVRALDDAHLLEIEAADFRQLAIANPGLIEQVGRVVAQRRIGLAEAQSTAAASATAATQIPKSLLSRIQRFLRLPH